MKKIAIHSVPRSGSTWLGSIFDSHPNVAYRYQPLFSYAFKSYLNLDSTKADVETFFRKIGESEDAFSNQLQEKERGIVPLFEKGKIEAVVYKEVRYHYLLEHLLKTCDDIKIIGLVRNPLATINSWLNAPKEFRKDLNWKVEEEWEKAPKKNSNLLEEYNGYVKWKEVTILFEELAKAYPNNFYLIKYSDLLNNPLEVTKSIFETLNLPWNEQTEAFISASGEKNIKDRYSVYKIKNNDDAWKKELPSYISEAIINDVKNSKLEEYL